MEPLQKQCQSRPYIGSPSRYLKKAAVLAVSSLLACSPKPDTTKFETPSSQSVQAEEKKMSIRDRLKAAYPDSADPEAEAEKTIADIQRLITALESRTSLPPSEVRLDALIVIGLLMEKTDHYKAVLDLLSPEERQALSDLSHHDYGGPSANVDAETAGKFPSLFSASIEIPVVIRSRSVYDVREAFDALKKERQEDRISRKGAMARLRYVYEGLLVAEPGNPQEQEELDKLEQEILDYRDKLRKGKERTAVAVQPKKPPAAQKVDEDRVRRDLEEIERQKKKEAAALERGRKHAEARRKREEAAEQRRRAQEDRLARAAAARESQNAVSSFNRSVSESESEYRALEGRVSGLERAAKENKGKLPKSKNKELAAAKRDVSSFRKKLSGLEVEAPEGTSTARLGSLKGRSDSLGQRLDSIRSDSSPLKLDRGPMVAGPNVSRSKAEIKDTPYVLNTSLKGKPIYVLRKDSYAVDLRPSRNDAKKIVQFEIALGGRGLRTFSFEVTVSPSQARNPDPLEDQVKEFVAFSVFHALSDGKSSSYFERTPGGGHTTQYEGDKANAINIAEQAGFSSFKRELSAD